MPEAITGQSSNLCNPSLQDFLAYAHASGGLAAIVAARCQFALNPRANILTISASPSSRALLSGSYMEVTLRKIGEFWWDGRDNSVPRVVLVDMADERIH